MAPTVLVLMTGLAVFAWSNAYHARHSLPAFNHHLWHGNLFGLAALVALAIVMEGA